MGSCESYIFGLIEHDVRRLAIGSAFLAIGLLTVYILIYVVMHEHVKNYHLKSNKKHFPKRYYPTRTKKKV